ncbi:MAG: class I SAM-dependent methyltransferase [Candidatus Giovannonibacteria bacterium]|nr:MAG: class I SAM-dependent methyltransferase [Candidatus Giovannonibacteria bacterium]
MKKFILFLPELIVFGLGFALFKFLIIGKKPLDPQKTWDLITKPGVFRKWVEDHYPPKMFRKFIISYYRHTLMYKSHSYGISKHYDISNEFYKLFLDKKYMFYSCADFIKSTESLEDAQENKANYLVNLIDPRPGEKILDLGCGWGSMLQKIYEVTGDKENLVGYTLSEEQTKYINEKYGFHVEFKDFITTKYQENSFDKIFSIGSWEHVRQKDLLLLSQKLRKAIKPNGRIVHHFFCQIDEVPCPNALAGGLSIFPGSELSSLQNHLNIFEKAGFRIVHHSIHDYRPTLRAWFERLAENKNRAIELVGLKNYNKYLYFFAGIWKLFDDHNLLIMRFVLEPNSIE